MNPKPAIIPNKNLRRRSEVEKLSFVQQTKLGKPSSKNVSPKKQRLRTPRRAINTSPRTSSVKQSNKAPTANSDSLEYELLRTQADMALHGDHIQKKVGSVQREIETRVKEESKGFEKDFLEDEDEDVEVSRIAGSMDSMHVGLSTPGSKPTTLTFSQNEIEERRLKSDSDYTLDAKNKFLLLIMNDLQGLQDWWTNNRKSWRVKKGDVERMEKGLSGLAMQIRKLRVEAQNRKLKAGEKRAKDRQRMRLYAVYESSKVRLDENLKWFSSSDYLMSIVKERFAELKGKTKSVALRRPQVVLEDDGGFKYTWKEANKHPRAYNVVSQTPSWWKNGAPVWWFTNAINKLVTRDEQFQEWIQVNSSSLEECKAAIRVQRSDITEQESLFQAQLSAIRNQIEDIIRQRSSANARHDKMQELERQLHEKNQEIISTLPEAQAYLQTLVEKRDMLEASLLDTRVQCERNYALLHYTRAITKNEAYVARSTTRLLNPRLFSYFEDLHSIICTHAFRHDLWLQLIDILEAPQMLYTQKKHFVTEVTLHNARFEDFQTEILELEENGQNVAPSDIVSLVYNEWNAFEDIVSHAQEILDQEINSSKDVTVSEFWTIEEPKTEFKVEDILLEDADELLKQAANRSLAPPKDLWTVICEFFTSPDIAPKFWSLPKSSFNHFYNKVYDLVDDDYNFSPREINAFLIACTHNNELFTLSGNFVTPNTLGWELVDESYISALPRKATIGGPPGFERFVRFMRRNEVRLLAAMGICRGGGRRDVDEEKVVTVLKLYYPHKMGGFALKEYLACLSELGWLFRYTDRVHRDKPILRLIDQGWNVLSPTFAPLFSISSTINASLLDEIASLLRQNPEAIRKIRSYITTGITESNLYDLLEKNSFIFTQAPVLQKGEGTTLGMIFRRIFSKKRNRVSKARFHIFLRRCGETGEMFRLGKEGMVWPVTEGW